MAQEERAQLEVTAQIQPFGLPQWWRRADKAGKVQRGALAGPAGRQLQNLRGVPVVIGAQIAAQARGVVVPAPQVVLAGKAELAELPPRITAPEVVPLAFILARTM